MAPLTTLVVAGVAGLLLAKAKRERRAAAARQGALRGQPSLLANEPPVSGLRRVALGQLDLAIELLEDYPGAGDERTVHEIRKALKRVRALMRALRYSLGAKQFAREDAALRKCAQRLAGARDAEVMVGTLDALAKRHPRELAGSAAVGSLRAELLAERERAADRAVRDPALRRAVAGDLRGIRTRIARWEPRKQGTKPLTPGLERVYRQGRRGLRRARRRADVKSLHAWRKRVKDLRYAAEALERKDVAAKRRVRAAKRLRVVARRADRLGEVLGEEHDLALLAGVVRDRSGHFAAERRTRKHLMKLIAHRRKRLRRRALRDGERLYRRKPRRFVGRLLADL